MPIIPQQKTANCFSLGQVVNTAAIRACMATHMPEIATSFVLAKRYFGESTFIQYPTKALNCQRGQSTHYYSWTLKQTSRLLNKCSKPHDFDKRIKPWGSYLFTPVKISNCLILKYVLFNYENKRKCFQLVVNYFIWENRLFFPLFSVELISFY